MRAWAILTLLVITTASPIPLGGSAEQGGTLGPSDALGQEIRMAPAPTGPAPRLPDGTIDMNGLWIGGGSNVDIEREGGLKPGGIDNLLLPWAKALLEERRQRPADDPIVWCLPFSVPRGSVYPLRFVQNYTHKASTHIFVVYQSNIHSFRQIFMDGRTHPPTLESNLVRPFDRSLRGQYARHRHGGIQRQVLVRSGRPAPH